MLCLFYKVEVFILKRKWYIFVFSFLLYYLTIPISVGFATEILPMDQVIIDSTSAINQNSDDAVAYCKRGIAYTFKNQYNLANNDFNKAIAINPKYTYAYFCRSAFYSKQNKNDLALSDVNKVIQLDPYYAEAYTLRAASYSLNKQYDLAINDCNKAIEINPKLSNAYGVLGEAYEKKLAYKEAINVYRRLILNAMLPQDKSIVDQAKNRIRLLGGDI